MRTYAHICIHMYTHARICTHMRTYAHICIHMHTHAHMCTHMHTYACICTHKHTHAYICTHMHTDAYICTHIHTYAYICTHTRTRRHIESSYPWFGHQQLSPVWPSVWGQIMPFPLLLRTRLQKQPWGPKRYKRGFRREHQRQSTAIAQLPETALRPLRHVFAQSAYRSGIAARSEIGSFGLWKLTPPPPHPPPPPLP
jgi:hypothetical protein